MSEQPSGPTSQSYISQRLRLHYADWGNPDAPPLILVHGGQDHCRNWDWVAQDLRRDYHIIAPDLRGHGDSAWSPSGEYGLSAYVYDLAQLIHQQKLAPVRIIAHSMGGNVALRYAGVYPETVSKLVAIEGMGPSPAMMRRRMETSGPRRMRQWIEQKRGFAGRTPRRYATIEDAFHRMQEENKHLTPEQARYLTVHGAAQNEDGTWSWKFDNAVRLGGPGGLTVEEQREIWSNISAPVLLVRGTESWASDPAEDGRIKHFKNARLANIEGAGHWSHHDKLDVFMQQVEKFLAE